MKEKTKMITPCEFCKIYYYSEKRNRLNHFCKAQKKYVTNIDPSCDSFELTKIFWCKKNQYWIDTVACWCRKGKRAEKCITCKQVKSILHLKPKKERKFDRKIE